MANRNPSPANRFKKGQSGNPGGKTSAQRQLEIDNAAKATRIRAKVLDALLSKLEDAEGNYELDLSAGDALRLLKDSEERGFGAPEQALTFEGKMETTDMTDLELARRLAFILQRGIEKAKEIEAEAGASVT